MYNQTKKPRRRRDGKPGGLYRRPRGRPSKFDPDFQIPLILHYAKKGMSKTEVAAKLGVTRKTLWQNWPKQHPELLPALKMAEESMLAWWEKLARENLILKRGQKFNLRLGFVSL